MANTSNPALPNLGQAGVKEPTVVIVGQMDDFYVQISGALQSCSLNVGHLPAERLLYNLNGAQAGGRPNETAERKPALARHRRPVAAPLPPANLYLFNLVATPNRYDWQAAVRRLNVCEPDARIVLAFDEPATDTVEAAMDAGADEVLWSAELPAVSLVWKRIRDLVRRAESFLPAEMATSEDVIERPSRELSDDVKRDALARVDASLANGLPSAAARRAPLAEVLGVAVPELRAPSGRLDATKIAARLNVSVARLASAVGVTRQAISQTPDSPKVQSALDPIARVIGVLDDVLEPEDERRWLHATHPRLEGTTPIEAMMGGRAESVARMLESARGGGVD